MKSISPLISPFCIAVVWALLLSPASWGLEPRVKIDSPKDGSKIVQDQNSVLVRGKVSSQAARTPYVDIFFIVDTSGSTSNYAGVNFGDSANPPASAGGPGLGRPQIGIFGGGFGMGVPGFRNLSNSILAAEVGAARRLLSELDAQTTRVGLITFAEVAKLVQPLTHDFQQVQQELDDVLAAGPYGGTNMVEAIRTGIKELAGLGVSERRDDAVRVQFLLTDGFPTLPIGEGRRVTAEDTNLAINAARISGKAGIKVDVFALGEEALSYPAAAVGIAKESGGIFTPVARAADILSVLENVSVVGVDYVEAVNMTTGQRASQLRLAADGSFSAVVPMAEGLNRIQVLARASNGGTARDSVSVYYQHGDQRSLDLEVFLEKEKSLKLQVERLGKNKDEIQKEVEQGRQDSLGRSQQPPPQTEGPPR